MIIHGIHVPNADVQRISLASLHTSASLLGGPHAERDPLTDEVVLTLPHDSLGDQEMRFSSKSWYSVSPRAILFAYLERPDMPDFGQPMTAEALDLVRTFVTTLYSTEDEEDDEPNYTALEIALNTSETYARAMWNALAQVGRTAIPTDIATKKPIGEAELDRRRRKELRVGSSAKTSWTYTFTVDWAAFMRDLLGPLFALDTDFALPSWGESYQAWVWLCEERDAFYDAKPVQNGDHEVLA